MAQYTEKTGSSSHDNLVEFSLENFIIILGRFQAAYGSTGLKYTFSGCTVPARPWTPTLLKIKADLEEIVPYKYNFCLVK